MSVEDVKLVDVLRYLEKEIEVLDDTDNQYHDLEAAECYQQAYKWLARGLQSQGIDKGREEYDF